MQGRGGVGAILQVHVRALLVCEQRDDLVAACDGRDRQRGLAVGGARVEEGQALSLGHLATLHLRALTSLNAHESCGMT